MFYMRKPVFAICEQQRRILLRPSTPIFDNAFADFASLVGIYSISVSRSRLFGSVVRVLDFYPDIPGSNPTLGGFFFFSYASFLCYDFHVVRLGLVRDWTLLRLFRHESHNKGMKQKKIPA